MRLRSWILTLIVSAVVATTLGAGAATAATGPDMQVARLRWLGRRHVQ